MLTKYGMSNAQVLQAATVNGAALLGEEQVFGALATRLRADMIVVDGDPLQDLRALLHVDLVIKSGQKMAMSNPRISSPSQRQENPQKERSSRQANG